MKTVYRVCLFVSLGIIMLGFLLAIIAFAGGATWRVHLPWGPFRFTSNYTNYKFEEEDFIHGDDLNNMDNIDNNTNKGYNSINFSETYTGVKAIDLNIAFGEVQIKYGDEFSIRAINMNKDVFKCYIEDGVWYINNQYGTVKNIILDYEDALIELTVPDTFKADSFRLRLDAGSVAAKGITADELIIDVEAGSFFADSINAVNNCDFKVGAGEIEFKKMDLNNADIRCGFGSITMNGKLTGENTIDCSGYVEMNLDGKKSDYNYEVDCGIGNVMIDKQNYSFTASTQSINNNASDSFKLNCGFGSIVIKFK